MTPTPKVNREPIVEDAAEKAEYRDYFTVLFLHGVERMAEFQKQSIDLAVQQNTEFVEIVKKAAEKMPGGSRLPLLDLATGAVTRYADTQKSAIDFVVEQTQAWTDAFKDGAGMAKKSTEAATNVAKQTIERSLAVQKKALENSAAQTKAVVDIAKHQFGFSGAQADAMTESFQRGVDTIVEAQKELLDIVTHQVVAETLIQVFVSHTGGDFVACGAKSLPGAAKKVYASFVSGRVHAGIKRRKHKAKRRKHQAIRSLRTLPRLARRLPGRHVKDDDRRREYGELRADDGGDAGLLSVGFGAVPRGCRKVDVAGPATALPTFAAGRLRTG